MTQEEKARAYDEVVARINKAVSDGLVSENFGRDMLGIAESEDDRIVKAIERILYENYSDAAVIDGFEIAEIVTWLEKQKEQKPVNPSDDELQRHQDELYDFKVFATKQAKEHHISFVHDFEWNNFCAELLSYFAEQKPVDCIPDTANFDEGFKTGREVGFREGVESVKPVEWSEEDKSMLESIIHQYEEANDSASKQNASFSYNAELRFLKSLRPSWKPSEKQMVYLKEYVDKLEDHDASNGYSIMSDDFRVFNSLYNDLKKLK